jgi:hypothetical protein
MAAHAVGHDHQPAVQADGKTVLILGANPADIGGPPTPTDSAIAEVHRDRARTHGTSVIEERAKANERRRPFRSRRHRVEMTGRYDRCQIASF